jgi:hypothetical protein
MLVPRYSETLEVLYSSTTFVFALPIDLHCLQVTVSPEGLTHMSGLIISFGKVDWSNNGPFHQEGGLKEWENAVHGLEKMPGLSELQVWFYHGEFNVLKELVWPRRPWGARIEGKAVEQRHQKLFDLFATADVPEFTVNITWKPEDILSQREWPFRVNLQTNDEIYRGMSKFPYPIEPDMYS